MSGSGFRMKRQRDEDTSSSSDNDSDLETGANAIPLDVGVGASSTFLATSTSHQTPFEDVSGAANVPTIPPGSGVSAVTSMGISNEPMSFYPAEETEALPTTKTDSFMEGRAGVSTISILSRSTDDLPTVFSPVNMDFQEVPSRAADSTPTPNIDEGMLGAGTLEPGTFHEMASPHDLPRAWAANSMLGEGFQGPSSFAEALFSAGSTSWTCDSDDDYEEEGIEVMVPGMDYESSSEEEEEEQAETADIDVGTIPQIASRLLYLGAPITVQESLLSIFSFSQSEKLSGSGLAKLLKLIELHCPKPNNCLKTLNKLFSHFSNVKTPLKSYFYCTNCSKERTSSLDKCDDCTVLAPNVDQVIIVSLSDQLSHFYARPGFLDKIKYKSQRKKLNQENYEDIYDGSIFKELEQGVLSEMHNVALMWNTDGVSLYNSSNIQLWPFYLTLPQLPPAERYLTENVILGAIYIGESKPNPNIFLQKVYQQVPHLSEGFQVTIPDSSERLKVQAVIMCGSCDSPAKAAMFNQKMFNGYYSCPKCLAKGEKSERTGNVFVHPFEENAVARSEASYEEDASIAAANNAGLPQSARKAINGIKGPSYLYLMVVKMISSTSVDIMHAVYLGVMKQLLELWFHKSHKNEDFSLYKVRNVINSHLLSLKPPQCVKRLPSSLTHLPVLKAYELMLLLFYYLLPVLYGTMKQLYFHNFKLLVGGLSLLTQRSISVHDVSEAKHILTQFCKDFETLYGLRHMSFNLRLLLHLPSVVENLGSLVSTSCFGFEDLNGKLRSLIHGSRYAGTQLSSHISIFLRLPELVSNLEPGETKQFCKDVSHKWKRVKLMECISEHCYSVGEYSKMLNIPEWISQEINRYNPVSVFSFKRIRLNSVVITSNEYLKSKRTCSKFVKYSHNGIHDYGMVKMFIKLSMCSCEKKCVCPGLFFAFVAHFQLSSSFETVNPVHIIKHVHQVEQTDTVPFVPIDKIQNVCFHMIVNDVNFLCDPLTDLFN